MKHKHIVQMGVLLIFGAGVLFSIVAFGQPGLRRDQELLEISVILREADSAGWAAARQGMEQAAFDLGAELRFLTLDTKNHVEEQRALLAREVEGGAGAVILVPADPKRLADDVRQAAGKAAVVTIESDMSESGAAACVTADNEALGQALGQAALHGTPPGGRVVLLDGAPGSDGIQQRIAQAGRVLRESGRRADVVRLPPSPGVDAQASGWPDAVIAFDPSTLEQAVQFFRDKEKPPLLYGMGATNVVASGLERGEIVAIAAQNEFAAGYLAATAAVQSARGAARLAVEPMAFSMVRQEDMYAPDHQKLLFPVTR